MTRCGMLNLVSMMFAFWLFVWAKSMVSAIKTDNPQEIVEHIDTCLAEYQKKSESFLIETDMKVYQYLATKYPITWIVFYEDEEMEDWEYVQNLLIQASQYITDNGIPAAIAVVSIEENPDLVKMSAATGPISMKFISNRLKGFHSFYSRHEMMNIMNMTVYDILVPMQQFLHNILTDEKLDLLLARYSLALHDNITKDILSLEVEISENIEKNPDSLQSSLIHLYSNITSNLKEKGVGYLTRQFNSLQIYVNQPFATHRGSNHNIKIGIQERGIMVRELSIIQNCLSMIFEDDPEVNSLNKNAEEDLSLNFKKETVSPKRKRKADSDASLM